MANKGEELPLFKRFGIWFRRNERKFWALLLVLVIFSFGVSYTMSQVILSLGDRTVLECSGTSYKLPDLKKVKGLFDKIARINPALDYRSILFGNSQQETTFVEAMSTLLAALEEAEQLHLHIPPGQIHDAAKECYLASRAAEKFSALPGSEKPEDQTAQTKLFEDLKESIEWTPEAYRTWTYENSFSVPDFEHYLEKTFQLRSLLMFYNQQDLVSRKDLYDDFVKSNRKISLEFTAIEAEKHLAEITEESTDKELEEFYNKNINTFMQKDRIQFSYLKFPASHFEKEVKVTEEELLKKYDSTKAEKYIKSPLGVKPVFDFPLSPEEVVELEKISYLPFAEIKEELRGELIKTKSAQAGRSFGQILLKELAEAPAAPAIPGTTDEDKKIEKPETPEDIAQQYEYVEFNTTPFFTQDNAEKQLEDLYSQHTVKRWFDSFLKDDKKLSPPRYPLSTLEKDGFFIITSINGEKTKQLSFADSKEKVMTAVKMENASKIAEKTAQGLMLKIREGKNLSEVSGDLKIYTTEILEMADYNKGKILAGEEKIPTEIENNVFSNFFFRLEVDDKTTATPLKYTDSETGKITWYVFNLIGTDPPDSREFVKQEEHLKMQNQQRKQQMLKNRFPTNWGNYLTALTARHTTLIKN